MTLDTLNELTARFLTLTSALSALTYLIFFVFFDRRKSSLIKNHILIFVINVYLIYLAVFMVLSGFDFMNRPYHIFRAIMGLSSLLLCEAIFRRHAPKFYKLLTLFISLGLFLTLIFKDDIYFVKRLVDYYTIFHIFSLSLFIFAGLSKLNHLKEQIKSRVLIISKTFLIIASLATFHYLFMKHTTDLRIFGISGSIIIHSLLLSHRNKFNKFQFHPLFYGTIFSAISGAIVYYFIFREFNINTYILISTIILSLVLLFEQIEFIMIRKFKTINADFFDRLDDFTKITGLSLKDKINKAFNGVISYYSVDDFPMIHTNRIKEYFIQNNFEVNKTQIPKIKMIDKDLYHQLNELFYITNCDKLYLINNSCFNLLGFESDSMVATENQKMDANILKSVIEGRTNEY